MIRILFLLFILLINIMHADTLNTLLEEYKETSDNSLQTIDEKIGHVLIYSQKEIRLMQHNKLSDILKELPLVNLNRNRYGLTNLSLAGTKTMVSGFFRLFINDHEVSTVQTQSFALSWGELPLDFVDHIEIYYGDSSFSLGNETGIYFIRVYTKSAIKENSTELKTVITDNNSFSQSLTHSESFENGWSYLLFLNQNKLDYKNKYKNETLKNDSNYRYLYLEAKNDTTTIDIGYSDIKKDTFMGMALDITSDNGELASKNYFLDISKYFLTDNSLKLGASYNIYDRTYQEDNEKKLFIPTFFGSNMPISIDEDLRFTKTSAYISKNFKINNNHLLTSFHIKNKTYKIIDRTTTNNFQVKTKDIKFNDFTQETIYSFLIENDYKINDTLMLIGNAKYDRYERDAHIDDSNEKMYRIGMIYSPYDNIGIKSFYGETYLPPSFFNADLASVSNPDMKTQQYTIFTAEGILTTERSKFGITYHHVQIKDFLYFLNNPSVPGFININHKIKTRGLIFDYEYNFENGNKIDLNYYTTRSSESINNSNDGGFFKYMGSINKIEYFASFIYRNEYKYNKVSVKDSYNINIGVAYNYTKDISFSLKGENLLDNSTELVYYDAFSNSDFSLKDFDRTITLSVKWVF